MLRRTYSGVGRLALVSLLALTGLWLEGVSRGPNSRWLGGNRALAEPVPGLRPDDTLGREGSVVRQGERVNGRDRLQIEGGATRGSNLFHSFEDFNVQRLQDVYFANPAGIGAIVGRVTGDRLSAILGTLGVAGPADLFLLNPNGFVFGEHAVLDIRGSFVVSTGDRFAFANGLEFSATDPQAPSLLTVTAPIGLQPGQPLRGDIASQGRLEVGQNLTLLGQNLSLGGHLRAGGTLTLRATDSLRIRDRVDAPFQAVALGRLHLQGDRTLDILALSHPDSRLQSGGDLTLRSANPVIGDARYWSGGRFRVQQLDGTLGDLTSPTDPIIRSAGDVAFDTYEGTSLHIFSGGQVSANSITVTGPAIGVDGTDFVVEAVTLSDGTVLQVNGGDRPTVDIRAGMNPAAVMGTGVSGTVTQLDPPDPVLATRTGSGIAIGAIAVNASNGLVFLTNRYQADPTLAPGAIQVDTLNTGNIRGNLAPFVGAGGDVVIDARDGIRVGDRIDASAASGPAGDITLLAAGDVRLDGSLIRTDNQVVGPLPGRAGDITIRAGSVTALDGRLQSNTLGLGDAGLINILADGEVRFNGRTAGIANLIRQGAVGNSGGIRITADTILVENGAQLEARVGDRGRNNPQAEGRSGNIVLTGRNGVRFTGVNGGSSAAITSIEAGDVGEAGDIVIQAPIVEFTDGGQLQSNTIGVGDAGDIQIQARDRFVLGGGGRRLSSIFSRVNPQGVGTAGDIRITVSAGNMQITDQARILSEVEDGGRGRGGRITLIARDGIDIRQESIVTSRLGNTGSGSAGNIYIESQRGEINIRNQSEVRSEVENGGQGRGGDITIIARGDINIRDRVQISSNLRREGLETAGDIRIESRRGSIDISGNNRVRPTRITSETAGRGSGGDISIRAWDTISLGDRTRIRADLLRQVTPLGPIRAGDIRLEAQTIEASNDVEIEARTDGRGDGGNIRLLAGNITLENFVEVRNEVRDEARGNTGEIRLIAEDSVLLRDNVTIAGSVLEGGEGNAGNVIIRAERGTVTLDGANNADNPTRILTETRGEGNAGRLEISGRAGVELRDQVEVRSEVRQQGIGNAGDIRIESEAGSIRGIDTVTIAASVSGQGIGGAVRLAADEAIVLRRDVRVASDLASMGEGQAGNVTVTANTLRLSESAQVAVGTAGDGDAGSIRLEADTIEFDGAGSESFPTGAFSNVESGSTGDGGSITVEARSLTVTNSARLDASTRAPGDGGGVTVEAERIDLLRGGQIVTNTLSQGDAGEIQVNAGDRLLIQGTSSETEPAQASGLFARTDGAGDGGSIDVEVEGRLALRDGGEISASTTQTGAGGRITILADQVRLTEGGRISASTFGAGRGGSIRVRASDQILLSGFRGRGANGAASGIFTTTEAGATASGGRIVIRGDRLQITDQAVLSARTDSAGTGGSVRVTANRIDLSDGGQIISTALSSGDAGAIEMTADDSLTISGISTRRPLPDTVQIGQEGRNGLTPSGIFANTQGSGNAGNQVNVQAHRLRLAGGGEISASTSGTGDGGNLNLSFDQLQVEDGALISANTTRQAQGGRGGTIALRGNQVEVTGGGQISTRTAGSGDAGDLTLDIRDRLELAGRDTGLFASTTEDSSGQGGNITIDPEVVIIRDRASIEVTSQGAGRGGSIDLVAGRLELTNGGRIAADNAGSERGGDITVESGSLLLDNGSSISAETASLDGGNLVLTAEDFLVLRRGSTLSTNAGTDETSTGQGNGGNIVIDTRLLAAVLTENSDITANAFLGRGGSVDITAPLGIYGIALQPVETPLSDITVSSTFGASGSVTLNTPDVDPSRGATELPSALASPELNQVCQATGGESSSRFVDTGRGGVPPSPDYGGTGLATWDDVRSPAPSPDSNTTAPSPGSEDAEPATVVEAQGWVRQGDAIVLTAQPLEVIPYSSLQTPAGCVRQDDGRRSSDPLSAPQNPERPDQLNPGTEAEATETEVEP